LTVHPSASEADQTTELYTDYTEEPLEVRQETGRVTD